MKKIVGITSGLLTLIMALSILAQPVSALAAPELMPEGEWFDGEYYAANNPDVVAYYGSTNAKLMYEHYKKFGRMEGRAPLSPEDAEALSVNAASMNSIYMRGIATIGSTNERLSDAVVRSYFNRSVFIGDSVMVGYQLYLGAHKESLASGAKFLAATSYATFHALKEDSNMHPMYRGVKQAVWKSIAEMDVDRVFIMLGTNDLVGLEPGTISTNIYKLVDKIRAAKPGVEVNIISMTPVYAGTNKGYLNNDCIDALNILLLQGAIEHNTGFVDINSYLKGDDGAILPAYSSDHYVHETAAAYAIWDMHLRIYASGGM
ncbi:MAG: SGNH/GDSL hydrolase family protein [Lachnospiraceae bacterium]|nr:SGNH/GDSL hydrolase family protein [Lachnospiraceae bacterium]